MVFNTGAALLDAIVLAVVSQEKEGTYGCRGSPRFSGRFRVMQQPRTTMTRSSVAAAAAELEQHGGSERKETTEEGE